MASSESFANRLQRRYTFVSAKPPRLSSSSEPAISTPYLWAAFYGLASVELDSECTDTATLVHHSAGSYSSPSL